MTDAVENKFLVPGTIKTERVERDDVENSSACYEEVTVVKTEVVEEDPYNYNIIENEAGSSESHGAETPNQSSNENDINLVLVKELRSEDPDHDKHETDDNPVIGTECLLDKTIPKDILQVKRLQDNSYGVFGLKDISEGVIFGPHEGPEMVKGKRGYKHKIRNGGSIGAKDAERLNWMRYVKRAGEVNGRNLIVFRHEGKIYYRSSREIKGGEELSVYYGLGPGIGRARRPQPQIEEIKELPYKCLPCRIGFSHDKFLMHHNRVCPYKRREVDELNKKKVTFICSICKMGILDKKYYRRHIKVCERYSRRNEEQIVSDNTEGKLICNECGFSTKRKDYLRSHIMLHSNERKFKCPLCEKSFTGKRNLDTHVKVHDTQREKKFVCQYCDSSYHYKASLKHHVYAKHLNKKDYRCNACEYATTQKSTLRRHVLAKHSDEPKRFACNYCDYSTHDKGNLTGHVRVHTNEKPFTCAYQNCNYRGKTNGALRRHIKYRHTGEKSFKCDQCDYKSVTKAVLLRHMQRSHC